MGIKVLVRQFPAKKQPDLETGEMRFVESPGEIWYADSESRWMEGTWFTGSLFVDKNTKARSVEKRKEEIITKAKAFVEKNNAFNENFEIELTDFDGYYIFARYDSVHGLACILSNDPIPTTQEVTLEDKIRGTRKEAVIQPRRNLLFSMLHPGNALKDIATKFIYRVKPVDPKTKAAQDAIDETFEVLKDVMGKVVIRGEKIDELSDKAQQLEAASRLFRAKAEELADPGCFGWLTRRMGCTIL